MKISRLFLPKTASTVDRQFCHSSRRFDCQFGEFCLKPFANCVVIEKIQLVCLPPGPGRRHIRRDTVVPHARAPGFCDRVTVIRPNPSIGYQSQRGRWLSRDTPYCCTFYRFFRTMSDNVAKNEGLLKETTESAPTPQFSTSAHRQA